MFACIFIPSTTAQVPLRSPSQNETELLRTAYCFSPRVARIAPDTVALDIEGTEKLFGAPEVLAPIILERFCEAGWAVNVAVAANMDTAIHAARAFPGITVVPLGKESEALRSLPLSQLSSSPELEATWQRWGLRTFGDLASLPETGVAERLGLEGAQLHRIARGALHRALIPLITAPKFEASQELEYEVELLEPLAFILSSLLNQVCAALQASGKGAIELTLRLGLKSSAENVPHDWERVLRLPVPLCDSIALLKLLRLDLEAYPPQAPIIAAFLRAEPGDPRAIQNHLFIPPAPEPGRMQLTLARIGKLVGEDNAGSAELLDTHRPDAFAMCPFRVADASGNDSRRRIRAAPSIPNPKVAAGPEPAEGRIPVFACRIFRPPLYAEVECSGGMPAQIWARDIRGAIVRCAGPWRTSGEWWTAAQWERDEWDVEVKTEVRSRESEARRKTVGGGGAPSSATALYRIYRDVQTGSWYIAGCYD